MRSWTARSCQTQLCGRLRRSLAQGSFPTCAHRSPRSALFTKPLCNHYHQTSITLSQSLVAAPDAPYESPSISRYFPSDLRSDWSPSDKDDPDAWVKLLEPYLPQQLGPWTDSNVIKEAADKRAISKIIEQAHIKSQLDLLSYICLERGQWDIAVWLGCAIVDSSETPFRSRNISGALSSLMWPSTETLDDFAERRVKLDQIRAEDEDHFRPEVPTVSNRNKVPLNTLLYTLTPRKQRGPIDRSHAALGLLWISLGKMILNAAQKEFNQSSDVLSTVVIILSRLHEKGFLPDTIYRTPNNEDPTALQHNPLVAELSAEILLKSVSDNTARNPASDDIAKSLKSKISGHAPSQWLEYCLWCCVHGGWLEEAVAVVDRMRRINGDHRWRLMFWRDISLAMEEREVTKSRIVADNDMQHRLRQDQSAVTRTISTEVILALADGLAAMIQGDRQSSGLRLNSAVDHLHILRRVLDRDRMSLGTATWEAFITRLFNSPGLQGMETKPRLFETVLNMRKAYGDEPNANNAPIHNGQHADEGFPTYVYDGSAAVIGLYHRILSADIRARDVSGALRTLAALQTLTDKNKQVALDEFFAELKSTYVTDAEYPVYDGDGETFPGVDYPGFFPNLPPSIVAGLLDLLNESNAIELGRWMINSSDIDGPLIPQSSYGNQIIAPALIRFAATISDTELLQKVTRAQTTSVSGHTLVALCESRIRQADFDGAIDVFNLVRIHALHEWTVGGFCLLLRAIIVQIYGTESTDTSERACSLCQRLLRGDMGQVWGPSLTQIDTIVEVLASFDDRLRNICSNLIPRGYLFKADLPTEDFNYLLDAAVRIWGSYKGKQLWSMWCTEGQDRKLSPFHFYGQDSSIKLLPSVADQFSAASEGAAHSIEPSNEGLHGIIKPTLPTIRIIVQQALKEYREQSSGQQTAIEEGETNESTMEVGVQHAVLDWASSVLRTFGLAEGDIDYELQGYLSTQQPSLLLTKSYSPETLRIWRAFTGPRRKWAQATEEALRWFASTKDQKLLYEDQPSAERFLLLSLAKDMGLHGEVYGEGDLRSVTILKGGRPLVLFERFLPSKVVLLCLMAVEKSKDVTSRSGSCS